MSLLSPYCAWDKRLSKKICYLPNLVGGGLSSIPKLVLICTSVWLFIKRCVSFDIFFWVSSDWRPKPSPEFTTNTTPWEIQWWQPMQRRGHTAARICLRGWKVSRAPASLFLRMSQNVSPGHISCNVMYQSWFALSHPSTGQPSFIKPYQCLHQIKAHLVSLE